MAAAVRECLGTYPAVRLQHRGDYPAGKGLEAWQDAAGATLLKALIVTTRQSAWCKGRAQGVQRGPDGSADPEVGSGAAFEIVGSG